jgi:hypothetical protein
MQTIDVIGYIRETSFSVVGLPLKIVGLSDFVRGQERLLSFLNDTSKALEEIQEIITLVKKVGSLLLSLHKEDGVTPAPALEELRMTVAAAQSNLGLAEAELSTLIRDKPFPFFTCLSRESRRKQHLVPSGEF